MKLYRFHWSVYYGRVEGIFISTPTLIEKVIGSHVDFGSILGKHSQIYGSLEPEDLEVITDDIYFIDKFLKLFPNGIGYNPLNYMQYYCEDCDMEFEEPHDCLDSLPEG